MTAKRLGDALFCTPAIRRFEDSLPHVRFDLLALSPVAGEVFRRNPHIRSVFVETTRSAIRSVLAAYPLTINLTPEMAHHLPHPPARYLSIGATDFTEHRAAQLLRFVDSILVEPSTRSSSEYQIFPATDDAQQIRRLLVGQGIDVVHVTLVGIQLGCYRVATRGRHFWKPHRHRHRKVWAMEKYVLLAKRLHAAASSVRLILTGAPGERHLARRFLREFPSAIDLLGRTSVHELSALMDLLSALVTNDTGTMHLACARRTPLVALFGSNPPPIQKQRIEDISVTEVYAALRPLVAG